MEADRIEWQSEERYDLINIAKRQGTLYVETWNRENDSFEIRKFRTGGTWSAVMSISLEDWEDYAVMGTGFFVDKNENVYLTHGNEITRFSGEGQQSGSWKLRGNVCHWLENDSGQGAGIRGSCHRQSVGKGHLFRKRSQRWRLEIY